MGWGVLFLLLPVAAFTGWLIGRNGANTERHYEGEFSANYFKGVNYLLNEQSDKAIETFVQMLEVDSDTVETHFALGNLFLKRGEVDRAIRIHQNLIARPTLTRLQRQQALFELGKDYLRAGLLDRAEALFIQASENAELAPMALRHLLEVYQLEKEWQKAIDIALKLKNAKNLQDMEIMIAHFICEKAEEALRNNRSSEASHLVNKALDEDKNCVRASLLEAQMEIARHDYQGAIKSLQRVENQDASYLPEILSPLRESFQHLEREDELLTYLGALIQQKIVGSNFVLTYAELIDQKFGREEALLFLMQYLKETPSLRIMEKVIDWRAQENTINCKSDLEQLNKIISARLEQRSAYRCHNCGFISRTLNWQCPTCKRWNTVKPLSDLEVG